MSYDDISDRFDHHPPTAPLVATGHDTVRLNCKELALLLQFMLVPGREKSLALTNLEQTMFWANASIARAQTVHLPDELMKVSIVAIRYAHHTVCECDPNNRGECLACKLVEKMGFDPTT